MAEIMKATPGWQKAFKQFNKFMLLMWRFGWGAGVNGWPEVSGRIMVLVHTGRKSGLRRLTPINYTILNAGDEDVADGDEDVNNGDVYCTAGFGAAADWYRNIQANPRVEIWLPDGWWAGVAEDVTDEPGHIGRMRQVLIASGFAARLAGVDPHTISDEDLDRFTADYRLIRIHRTAARTGPGGPGDLAWFWPWTTLVLLLLIYRGRKK